MNRAVPSDQLCSLGVRTGGVLLVHVSYRAVRPVEGGPKGLIEALREVLGPDGTLVMPSWGGDDDRPFESATTPAARDLGVVADSFWRLLGVVREHLARDPLIFLHPAGSGCAECEEARQSVRV